MTEFTMRGLRFSTAGPTDAEELAALRNAVAQDQLKRFGVKSFNTTSRGILCDLRWGQIFIARRNHPIVSSLLLVKKKPWAVDVSYFTPVEYPLYVRSMNTLPGMQRKGAGSRLIEFVLKTAKQSGCQALRLDAFDAAHGAGGFYLKCGFTERGRTTYRGAPLVYFEYLL